MICSLWGDSLSGHWTHLSTLLVPHVRYNELDVMQWGQTGGQGSISDIVTVMYLSFPTLARVFDGKATA